LKIIGGLRVVGDGYDEEKTVMHVEVKNGATGDALISTGSSENFCSAAWARANGKEPSGETVQSGSYHSYGGTKATLGSIKSIFKINGEMKAQMFHVVETLPWDVVLGFPWAATHSTGFEHECRTISSSAPKKKMTVHLHIPSNIN